MSDDSDDLVSVTIIMKGGARHAFACPAEADVLKDLLRSIFPDGGGSEDRIVELALGGDTHRGVYFLRSNVESVETAPPIDLAAYLGRKHSGPAARGTATGARHFVIDDFLPAKLNQALLKCALKHRELLEPSGVVGRKAGRRQSQVLMSMGRVGQEFEAVLRMALPTALSQFDIDVPMTATVERQLTAHNDGDFFKFHTDAGGPDDDGTNTRALTYVYYFNKAPKPFDGGDLRLYYGAVDPETWAPPETFETIEPVNNRIVFFPSETWHQVMPITCNSKAFEDCRFTVNGWVHRAAANGGS